MFSPRKCNINSIRALNIRSAFRNDVLTGKYLEETNRSRMCVEGTRISHKGDDDDFRFLTLKYIDGA